MEYLRSWLSAWLTTWPRTDMGDQSEFNQLMLERMQALEEALRKAIAGVAYPDDWMLIRMECGLPKASIFNVTRSDT